MAPPLKKRTKHTGASNVMDDDGDEVWTCKICKHKFDDPDAKMLQCDRCDMHYCITCLGKTNEEYVFLANSDCLCCCNK